jgi:hypothetical protein
MGKPTAVLVAILIISPILLAQESSIERADRIARILGLEQYLHQAKQLTEASSRKEITLMYEELKKAGVSKDILDEIINEQDQIQDKLYNAWDSNEAAKIFSSQIAEQLTDQELAESESFYGTQTGRRSYVAISSGQAKMMEYINQRTSTVMQNWIRDFIARAKQGASNKVNFCLSLPLSVYSLANSSR